MSKTNETKKVNEKVEEIVKTKSKKEVKANTPDKKVNQEVLELKPSYQLTKEEIEKFPRFNVKLTKRVNTQRGYTSYSLSVNFSSHVHPRIALTQEQYYLALNEIENGNYITQREETRDSENLYVQGLPVRIYHVYRENEGKEPTDYKKYNIFVGENSIFTEYFKFAESILLLKERPDLDYIKVRNDNDAANSETEGGFVDLRF